MAKRDLIMQLLDELAQDVDVNSRVLVEEAKAALSKMPNGMHCSTCGAERHVDKCHRCGLPTFEPHHAWENPKLPEFREIQRAAAMFGYVAAIHGSFERDLDVVLIPWTDKAIDSKLIAVRIAEELELRLSDIIESKPFGRFAMTAQYLRRYCKPIDLSVIPTNTARQTTTITTSKGDSRDI